MDLYGKMHGDTIVVSPTFPFGSTSCIRFKGYYLSPYIGTPLKFRQNYLKIPVIKILAQETDVKVEQGFASGAGNC